MSIRLETATVRAVVEHMNDDHQDACLAIVQAFSDLTTAHSAKLIGLDSHGMQFLVQCEPAKPDEPTRQGRPAAPATITINFPKPLNRESQLRGVLVGMTRQARAKLDSD
jgi:putative heme iron utilization protein